MLLFNSKALNVSLLFSTVTVVKDTLSPLLGFLYLSIAMEKAKKMLTIALSVEQAKLQVLVFSL